LEQAVKAAEAARPTLGRDTAATSEEAQTAQPVLDRAAFRVEAEKQGRIASVD
jgi:hypothetical protein